MRGRSVTDEYVGPQKRLAWQRYRQGPRSHFEGIRALSLLHNVYYVKSPLTPTQDYQNSASRRLISPSSGGALL